MKKSARDEIRALAFEALDSGQSVREVAELAGVCKATVARWAKMARPSEGAPLTREAPTPVEGLDVDGDAGTLESVVHMQRGMLRVADEAQKVGNFTAAQRALRDAGALSNTIARLEKVGAQEKDILRISRAEISAAIEGHRERLAKLAARPLLCARCSRELSIEWGERDEDELEGEA